LEEGAPAAARGRERLFERIESDRSFRH
jgi:hypothetical protein